MAENTIVSTKVQRSPPLDCIFMNRRQTLLKVLVTKLTVFLEHCNGIHKKEAQNPYLYVGCCVTGTKISC